MIIWLLILFIPLCVVGTLGTIAIFQKYSVRSLIVYTSICIVMAICWWAAQEYVYERAIADTCIVAQHADIEFDHNIYYDDAVGSYFYIEMGNWDIDYHKVRLDDKMVNKYIQLTQQLEDITLERMMK